MQGTQEDQKYRSFIQPQKGPNANIDNQNYKLQNNKSELGNLNMTKFDDDYSQGQSQKDFVSLQQKLSQLQSWVRNIDEELTNDRRDLILLQGKVNTLEIHTKYEVEQFRKLTDVDAKRLQSQMDQGFQNQRQNHFDLKKQVNDEESHHKQQKKEIIQIQKKIGSMEQEVGPGNIKKSQERQLKLQQIKQSKMEETLTQHPDVSFINNNNINNSTFLNNESLINNTFHSVSKSGFITQN